MEKTIKETTRLLAQGLIDSDEADKILLGLFGVISCAIDELDKKAKQYSKASQNAVDEFDDNVNYGKSRAMQEAYEMLKKRCL